MYNLSALKNFLKIHAIFQNSHKNPNIINIPDYARKKQFLSILTGNILPFYMLDKLDTPLPFISNEKMVTEFESEMTFIEATLNLETGLISLKEGGQIFLLDTVIKPVLQYLANKGYDDIVQPKEDLEIAAAFMKYFFNEDIQGIEPNQKVIKLLGLKSIINLYSSDLYSFKELLNGNIDGTYFIDRTYFIDVADQYFEFDIETKDGAFQFAMLYPSNLDLDILSSTFKIELPSLQALHLAS
jgi:hypothetical protein